MSDLRKDQINVFNAFEVLEQATEKTILNNYARSLVNMKSYLSGLFEMYEDDGRLSYDDMALYNRLERMSGELRGLTVSLYRENSKVITSTLKSTYPNAFTGTGEAVSRAWGSRSLRGIIREEEMRRTLTNEISGLKWAERMGLRREQAAAKVCETIVQGLQNGETYRQMAERLNETVGRDVPNAIRIVRTESYRAFAEARKDRLDRVHGVDMIKEWITSLDEAVRSNHRPMHGAKVPYRQNFVLPNGNEGFGPGMFGDPKDDINCRCFYVVDDADNISRKSYTQGVDFDADGGIIDAEGEVVNLIPNHDKVFIPREKFTEYALNEDKSPDKAIAFRDALGYTNNNASRLIENIRTNISDYESVFKGNNGFGDTYECVMNLWGPNGKNANVVTSWIIKDGTDIPRLTSAYVTKKKPR